MKPIIIIHSNEQQVEVTQLLQANKSKFLVGIEGNNLQEIRTWDYGILLLNSE